MRINLIYSTDPNGVIGIGDDLAIFDKEDMKLFKSLTSGEDKAIVVGSNTFKSIGSKPLCDRLNLVLSKSLPRLDEDNIPNMKDIKLCRSMNEVFRICEECSINELWVIGGKQVYEQFLDLADALIVTHFNRYAEDNEDNVYFLPDLSLFEPHEVLLTTDSFQTIHYTRTY